MASKAIEFRLRDAEHQLAQLREDSLHLRDTAQRLEEQIEGLRRALAREEGPQSASSAAPPRPAAPARSAATPPPIPPPLPPPAPATAPSSPPPSTPAPPLWRKIFAGRESASRAAPAAPTAGEPEREREGLELEFGRVWFVRIGIGLLLTGFVFLSTYAYQNYIVNWGAGYRVAALYTAAVFLAAAGFFLERWKESLRNYGRVVAAGGWAAIYYTTYAAHHVERLRVIESPVVAAVLLSLVALAFFAYAASKKSSILTVGSLVLAFYATAINPMGWLGCFSGLLLSAIGVFFFLRYRWLQTGVTSLAGAYLSYAYWHVIVNASLPGDLTRWFLVGYWLLFSAAILAPQAGAHTRDFRVAFASANNLLFFFLFAFHFPGATWVEPLWLTALVFGSVLVGISVGLALRGGSPALLRDIFLAKGLALITWGISLELTGEHLFLTLALEALVLAVLWRGTRSAVLRTFVWISAAWATLLALTYLIPGGKSAPDLAYLIYGGLFVLLAGLMRGGPWISRDTRAFSIEALAASLAAFVVPTAAYLVSSDASQVGLVMMGIGLALWIAYLIRPQRWPLPEFVWLAQAFGALGALFVMAGATASWHLALVAALGAVAFHLHGLASDGKWSLDLPRASQGFEYAFSGISLLASALWMFGEIDSPNLLLLLLTALPLAVHFYGSLLRREAVAALAQLFYIGTLALSALAWQWSGAEAPSQFTALLAVLIVVAHFLAIQFIPFLRFREIVRETHLVAAALLWSGWVFAFVDSWYLVFAWTGFVLFCLPANLHAKSLRPAFLLFLAAALGGVTLFEESEFWMRYGTLPAVFLVHLMGSRRECESRPERASLWAALAGFLVLALTVVVSQHTLDVFEGKGLAIAWALLGLLFFGLGLGVRVRLYRFGGLALLALSLGHVLALDVWKLDTILRIISFLTLGLVLLTLGFVYNRWHETLRKLL